MLKVSRFIVLLLIIFGIGKPTVSQTNTDSLIAQIKSKQWQKIDYNTKVKKLITAIRNNYVLNTEHALLLTTELYKIAINQKDSITEVDALKYKGNCHLYQNKFVMAILQYTKSQRRAKEIGYLEGEAAAFHNIAYIYFKTDKYNKALTYFQKALKIDSTANNKNGIFESLVGIGAVYEKKRQFPKAKYNLEMALSIAEKLNDSIAIARILHNIGEVHKTEGKLRASIQYLDSANKYLQYEKTSILKIQNEYSIGEIYEKQSDYKNALKNYRFVILQSRTMNYPKGEAMALNNIGNILKNQKKLNAALQNYLRSLEIMKTINDNTGIIVASDNIGNIYEQLHDYERALRYYRKALQIKQNLNSIGAIAVSKSNVGMLYLKLNETNNAISFMQEAYKMNKLAGNKIEMANDAKNLGIIYTQLREYNNAEQYIRQSLAMAEEMNLLQLQKSNYGLLSNIYAQKNNYKKAYEYNHKFTVLKDSIFNIETQKQLDDIRTLYETDKKEQENKLLKEQARANEQTMKRRNTAIVGVTGIAIIAIILIVVILKSRTKLKQKNSKISTQKKEIQQQAQALQKSNEQLVELDNFKQGMTSMIVHDLKNPLAAMLSIIEKHQKYTIDNRLHQHTNMMLSMVSNILDVQKLEDTKMTLNKKSFTISSVIYKIISDVKFMANEKNITIYPPIGEEVSIVADKDITGRILLNLLTNALKYTPPNGKIWINNDINENKKVKISIKDTGGGIPKKFHAAIFDKFGQLEARKAGKARSTGLGLAFCKLAVEAHGGNIGVESEANRGATFWFTMQLASEQKKENMLQYEIVQKTKIELNANEKEILKPYIEQLQKLKAYEISKIQKVLNVVQNTNNENINTWKQAVQKAVRTFNVELLDELLNIK